MSCYVRQGLYRTLDLHVSLSPSVFGFQLVVLLCSPLFDPYRTKSSGGAPTEGLSKRRTEEPAASLRVKWYTSLAWSPGKCRSFIRRCRCSGSWTTRTSCGCVKSSTPRWLLHYRNMLMAVLLSPLTLQLLWYMICWKERRRRRSVCGGVQNLDPVWTVFCAA